MRYGEKAEEVEMLEYWSCPRCRGICNCSLCMKKRGHQPTGILKHTAKATGYSSVSELLHVKGPENFGHDKNVKDTGALPKKPAASEKEALIASPRKRGKENSFDGMIDVNLHPLPLPPNPVENKPKKMKQEASGKMRDGNLSNGDLLKKSSPYPDEKKPKKIKQGALKKMHAVERDAVAFLKETNPRADEKKTKKLKREELKEMHDGALLEGCPKRPRNSNESNNKEVKTNGKVDSVLEEGKSSKTRDSKKVPLDPFRKKKKHADRDNKTHEDVEELDKSKNQNDGAHHKMVVESHKDKRKALHIQTRDLNADIPLPNGTELTTVSGIELPLKDVGNALQFLEFCAAFGKILNLKKEQPNFILKELIHGRSRRQGQCSVIVQFHIQLLSLIQKESGAVAQALSPTHGKDSWLRALKNCISESQYALNSLPFDCLDRVTGGYETLDSSTKLRLLNFLCDKVLETARIRNWIDDQNLKFAEKAKEAKERVFATKEKKKHLRQKLLNEVAKAIIAKNGAPISISEHDDIVSQIKFEAAQAHAEMLDSMGMVPKKSQRSDAIRTEPILLHVDGRAYWRLKGYSDKSNILLQDIGVGDDAVALGEKWFAFDVDQEKVIEKHISFRGKRAKGSNSYLDDYIS